MYGRWLRPPLEKTSMMIENVAAPLAQALADKGYETLTSVQEAVLAEGVAGRDALVSAQTGSGKTVAFGLAVAPEILGGQELGGRPGAGSRRRGSRRCICNGTAMAGTCGSCCGS